LSQFYANPKPLASARKDPLVYGPKGGCNTTDSSGEAGEHLGYRGVDIFGLGERFKNWEQAIEFELSNSC